MFRRAKDVESSDAADQNGDPLLGSADPFDALVSGKADDASASRSNGKRQPSPIPGMVLIFVKVCAFFSSVFSVECKLNEFSTTHLS